MKKKFYKLAARSDCFKSGPSLFVIPASSFGCVTAIKDQCVPFYDNLYQL